MNLQVYVRSQTELEDDHDAFLAGESNARWSVDKHYRALNYALREWGDWVATPRLYSISSGFDPGTYTYSIPDYIDGRIEPQFKLPGDPTDTASLSLEGDDWRTLARYSIDPTSTGGRVLRLPTNPHTSDARILWWARNGPLPVAATLPVTSAEISASAESVTITTKPTIGRSGYIFIDAEWLSYAGVTEGATTLTLTNLVRGLFGTTAAVHSITSDVDFGIAVQDPRLWTWLLYLSACYLHLQYMNKSTGEQRDYHEFQYRVFRQLADEFRASFRGVHTSRMVLSANPM